MNPVAVMTLPGTTSLQRILSHDATRRLLEVHTKGGRLESILLDEAALDANDLDACPLLHLRCASIADGESAHGHVVGLHEEDGVRRSAIENRAGLADELQRPVDHDGRLAIDARRHDNSRERGGAGDACA